MVLLMGKSYSSVINPNYLKRKADFGEKVKTTCICDPQDKDSCVQDISAEIMFATETGNSSLNSLLLLSTNYRYHEFLF
jgi:hypothetical protein